MRSWCYEEYSELDSIKLNPDEENNFGFIYLPAQS